MRTDDYHSCPEYLLKATADSHPLLNDLWQVLEKAYRRNDRQWIYDNIPKKLISIRLHGAYLYQTPSYDHATKPEPVQVNLPLEDFPIFNIKPPDVTLPVKNIPRQNDGEVTDFEDFLQAVYHIEENTGRHVSLDAADEAVNRLTDAGDIRRIKTVLRKNVSYLREEYQKIGGWAIFPDIDAIYIQKRFTDFQSFKKAFFKDVRPALSKKRVPDVRCGCTCYNFLINQIEETASSITHYLKAGAFTTENLGRLLWSVSNLARTFERCHNELFYGQIITGVKVQNAEIRAAKQTNERKQKHYPWLKEIAVTMVKTHPSYSITRAAQELKKVWDKEGFRTKINDKDTNQYIEKKLTISTKTIKTVICKAELAPLNKTKKI